MRWVVSPAPATSRPPHPPLFSRPFSLGIAGGRPGGGGRCVRRRRTRKLAVTRTGPLVSSADRNIRLRSASSRLPRAPSGADPSLRRRPLSLCGAAHSRWGCKDFKAFYFISFVEIFPRGYTETDESADLNMKYLNVGSVWIRVIALFSDFSFDGHYSFRISRWPVSVTSFVTVLSNSSSISSSTSGDDNAPESVPTSNTFANFGGFMTFSKTRYLDSLPLLKRRVHEYNLAYLIFYKFACLGACYLRFFFAFSCCFYCVLT